MEHPSKMDLFTDFPNLGGRIFQLMKIKNRLEIEVEMAKQRESDANKYIASLETIINSQNLKTESTERLRKRCNQLQETCESLSQKILALKEDLFKTLEFSRLFKDENEKYKVEIMKLKADKQKISDANRFTKKNVPDLLKLIDELAGTSTELPFPLRRKIDFFAEQSVRLQLLGGAAILEEQNNEEMIQEIETLVTGGIRVAAPVKKPQSTGRREKASRAINTNKRIKRNEQHNIEENENAINAILQNKLSKADEVTQPKSEIISGHRTIHGKKGPTIREQQAEMAPVKERVAQMKQCKAEPVETALPKNILLDEKSDLVINTNEENNNNICMTKHNENQKLADDLHLSPSPEKDCFSEGALVIDIEYEEEHLEMSRKTENEEKEEPHTVEKKKPSNTRKRKANSNPEDNPIVTSALKETQKLINFLTICHKCYKNNIQNASDSIFNVQKPINDIAPSLVMLIARGHKKMLKYMEKLFKDKKFHSTTVATKLLKHASDCAGLITDVLKLLEIQLDEDSPSIRVKLHESLKRFLDEYNETVKIHVEK